MVTPAILDFGFWMQGLTVTHGESNDDRSSPGAVQPSTGTRAAVRVSEVGAIGRDYRSNARALVADTRSIWMQCRKL
ncbi:hypothetical protein QT972_30375 [Microcoleus sp. herbarium7]